MFKISDYFKKIQNVYTKQLFVTSVIQKVIKESFGLELEAKQISFNGQVLVLKNIPTTIRSEIFIKKAQLIKALNESQQIKLITDIR